VPKLDIGVERASRLAPTFRNVKAKLGGEHIADDQHIGIETISREQTQFILPEPNKTVRTHLQRNKTKRRESVTLNAAIG